MKDADRAKIERALVVLAECVDALEAPHVAGVRHGPHFRSRRDLILGILHAEE